MKRFMKILGVVLALVLVFGAVGCALETPETGLEGRIAALEDRISGLEAAIVNIPTADTSALSNELTNLRNELGTIRASLENEDQSLANQLADLEDMIAALENGDGNGNGNGDEEPESETARWSHSAHALNENLDIDLEDIDMVDMRYIIKPSTVEDADVYGVTLYLTNLNTVSTTGIDLVVEFNFTPRHGARAYVDEEHTYMDTTKFPYTYWDIEVYEKGDDKYTTRISCLSETIHLSPPVADNGGWIYKEIYKKLEFTLAYK